MQHVPVGVFRDITRPTYDDLVREQVDHAITTGGGPPTDDDIAALLAGNDTWTVGENPSTRLATDA
jgi:2-oxoglutarate ferredoxin oxidoreductase subunit beta